MGRSREVTELPWVPQEGTSAPAPEGGLETLRGGWQKRRAPLGPAVGQLGRDHGAMSLAGAIWQVDGP